MTEDGRLAILLDWVREFEALDDEQRDKHMKTLAATAALDAGSTSAIAFWQALYALALVVDDHGSPPPIEAVQAVRAALARVLDADLLWNPSSDRPPLHDATHEARGLADAPWSAPRCWHALTALLMAERRDRKALYRDGQQPERDPLDGWGTEA